MMKNGESIFEEEYLKLAVNGDALKRMFDDLADLVQNQKTYQRMFILMGRGKEGQSILTQAIASMFPDDSNITVDEDMILKD